MSIYFIETGIVIRTLRGTLYNLLNFKLINYISMASLWLTLGHNFFDTHLCNLTFGFNEIKNYQRLENATFKNFNTRNCISKSFALYKY